ncbi:hypothetical protein SUGI_0207910 [Cryptomeria japonica]|nr:hypothetical protein SUGI_0207910 [Cryptomeria japonica]
MFIHRYYKSRPISHRWLSMANPKCILKGIIFVTMIVADVRAVSFNFSSFMPNMDEIIYSGDALTSEGRAVYYQPAWRRTSQPTFTFLITNATDSSFGDGLAFFVAAAGARLNLNSTGGWLGLTDCATDANSSNQIVVVEFDTWQNEWDPPSDHIGIDVNSVRSVVNKTLPDQSALRRGSKSETWVEYQGMRLSVFLSSNGLRGATPDMYYNIDLRQYFPEWVTVGFAASTGDSTELHSLLSWEFSISDPPPAKKLTHRRAIFAAAIIIPVLTIVVLCAVLYRRWYYSQLQVDLDIDVEIHRWLVYGPRRFRHKELCLATRGFAEKLGHGGFGGVYYGTLPGLMLRWPSSVSPEVPNRARRNIYQRLVSSVNCGTKTWSGFSGGVTKGWSCY